MACSYYHHENEVELNLPPNLRRQMQDYRIDKVAFTVEKAKTIANFLSYDEQDRLIRSGLAWNDDSFRVQVYFYLHDFLELLSQNTPLSILDKHMDKFSILIHQLKRWFNGEWLRDLQFLKDYYEYRHEVIEELEFIKEGLKEKSRYIQRRMKNQLNCFVCDGSETLPNGKRRYDEQVGRRLLALSKKRLKYVEDELMRVRAKLKSVLKARDELASLEFNIFSRDIIRDKVTSFAT